MKTHKCFKTVNKKLREQNTMLVANLLNPNHVFIETQKIDKKKRKKPASVMASYCPFCGEYMEYN